MSKKINWKQLHKELMEKVLGMVSRMKNVPIELQFIEDIFSDESFESEKDYKNACEGLQECVRDIKKENIRFKKIYRATLPR